MAQPYLNTPRSLEACRLHGVNPADLVEVPFREFRKAYPNDEEAALRRFERMDGVRKCLLETVTEEWRRIASRGSLTGLPLTKTESENRVAIIDVDPVAYTPLLEIQAKRLQKVEEQQYLGLKKMVTNQMNEAIMESKAKQIIAKQDNISQQNQAMKRKRMLDRENVLREQREEARYKEMLAAQEVRLEQQRAAAEAKRQKERRKEAEKADKKRQQKREEDRLLQEAYLKKLKADEKQKADEEAAKKMKKFADEAKENEIKLAAEKERRQLEQVRIRNEMIAKIEKAKQESHKRAEERRLEILNRINNSDQKAETLHAEKLRKQREEAAAKDKALQDKINQIKGQSDDILNEKIKRTLEALEKKHNSSTNELTKAQKELERRRAIKEIKKDAFEQNLQRVRTAEAYRMKKIEESLAVKDAKAKAIKDGMAAFQAFRENMAETVAKTRGELKREAFNLSHQNRLNPDNLLDAVHDNSQRHLFPRLHHTFTPATADEDPLKSPPRKNRSPSPNKDGHEQFQDPPKSPIARAYYKLNDFKENRLTTEMIETRQAIEKRNAELLLPYSMTLGARRNEELSRSQNCLSRTAPAEGSDRPHTTGGSKRQKRNTVLSAPGSRFVDENVLAEANAQEQDGVVNTDNWGTEDLADYPGGEGDQNQPESIGREYDATDDDNLFFQPVPSLPSIQKKKNKSKAASPPKPGGAFKPPKPKGDEFRREYSADHPLAPGGTGKYEADRAGGKKHPVGWIDSNKQASQTEPTKEYPKLVIHQTRGPQSDSVVKDVTQWQAEIDAMRRQQNQALLKLLDEERIAEEDRGKMGKLVKDHEERHRLELVFSEERKRASERIINLTRQHEMNIKEATGRLKDLEPV